MLKIGIFGAAGYTGFYLIKYLLNYENVSIDCITSTSKIDAKYSDIYPFFINKFEKKFISSDEALNYDLDAAFLALPHTQSFNYVDKLLAKKTKVIDLSADYRFNDFNTYEKYYKVQHNDKKNLSKAVYGIPEINAAEIKNSSLIANPGCYPTSAIIPLFPLLKENFINNEKIIINSNSGVSGAGKKPAENIIFCEVAEDFKPYNILEHRHKPEIDEKLFYFTKQKTDVIFIPHLLPIKQGMFTTIYAELKSDINAEKISQLFYEYYSKEKYVRIRKTIPKITDVVFTNYIDIFFTIKNNTLIIFSVIDNLIKGASGQALQNFNLLFDLDINLNECKFNHSNL
ncbi:MAG TPA: N-acetyl-gamma-glutamyl-phosphate reductase [bacterium]|nr:N-acetyl-gamma-glutamyl-phosphate reductase [bacterium]HPQ19456.1 N-acetyl-gamma-glutamyl-phosphate reductase [bacterium]